VEGIEVFEDAIENYEGTVIVVSHDRAFLRELATRVWAISDGRLEDYDGPFVDWEVREEERVRAQAASQVTAEKKPPTATKRRGPKPPDPARLRRNATNAVQTAELDVEKAEARVAAIEAQLADGDLYDGTAEGTLRATELGRALDEARAALDEAIAAWSDAVEVLDSLEE